MLLDVYTLGSGGDAIVYSKQFADSGKSKFNVQGLTAVEAQSLTVSHQPSSTGRVRTMVRLDSMAPVTGLNGPVGVQSSVYLVLDRAPALSAVNAKKLISRLNTVIDDADFISALLNQEV